MRWRRINILFPISQITTSRSLHLYLIILPHFIMNNTHSLTNNNEDPPGSFSSNPPQSTLTRPSPNFKIGTLNCRGLRKTADPTVSSQFIRYLNKQSFDILALQETHATNTDISDLFHRQFKASDSYWSQYCGIVCFSSVLTLTDPIWDSVERTLTVKVSHIHEIFDPVFVTVLYAPANYNSRQTYLTPSLLNPNNIFPHSPTRHIILGDFNYSSTTVISSHNFLAAPAPWIQYLDDHYQDSILATDQTHQSTFHRGNSRSCIDYIYVSNDLTSSCHAQTAIFIQPAWSDHMLLCLSLYLEPPPAPDDSQTTLPKVGKGIWRAHPRLASSKSFRRQLYTTLSDLITKLPSDMTVQLKWDTIKTIVKTEAKKYSRKQAYSLSTAEKLLQRKRAGISKRILQDSSLSSILLPQLQIVEYQLASIQQHYVDNLALRSALRWREQGELSAGYLKQTVSQRQQKLLFKAIRHPTSSILCTSTEDMLNAAEAFYSDLYSPDHVNTEAIDDLLQSLPPTLHLSEPDQYWLAGSFTWDDILEGVSRCPRKSSPGIDGLPYEILRLVFLHPDCRDILLQVYNDALHHGIFPNSWLRTCVSLLPKKGDLNDLKNWRPISLINTDAKVFTRLLNSRIVHCADDLITPLQSGFLHGRFIADNGLLMKMVMAHARSSDSKAIGLLLDQEKAYDRVHPEYLRRVLQHFRFPVGIIRCISNLFFQTNLQLNINGHLSSPVPQLRGLRQGDPLSPVLFNLAFEPFLRRLLHDSSFIGFSLPRSISAPPSLNHTIKVLAYADDVACFLASPSDLTVLNRHIDTYSAASNARINFHKTEAFALSGKQSIYDNTWRAPLVQSNISAWHDITTASPIIYLGYPLFHAPHQRDVFLTSLLSKLEHACNIHSHRSLSFRGRVTITNSLLLSKLWYVLRVVTVPKTFLSSVVSLVSGFISRRCFPRISFATMTLPRKSGGLGLLNPFVQQSALQLRWILPLLASSNLASSFWITEDLQQSIVLPLLADYLLYHIESTSTGDNLLNGALNFDYRLCFLFPFLRPPLLFNRRDDPLYLLFQTVDAMPKDYSKVVINSVTALQIPIANIILPVSTNNVRESTLRLSTKAIYITDTTTSVTRPRTRSEITTSPILAKLFLRGVRTDQIRLAPYFIRTFIEARFAGLSSHPYDPVTHAISDAQPLIESCPIMISKRQFSSKLFRLMCASTPSLPPRQLTVTKWLFFWQFPILHMARNVWYRLLSNKLACRSVLHRFIPMVVSTPFCVVCSMSLIETDHHFVYECPLKLMVWQELWPSFFDVPFSTDLLKQALFELNFPPASTANNLPPSVCIGHTLLAVWRSHFNFVFNEQPFLSSVVIAQTRSMLVTSFREKMVRLGQTPFPLPHFSIDPL